MAKGNSKLSGGAGGSNAKYHGFIIEDENGNVQKLAIEAGKVVFNELYLFVSRKQTINCSANIKVFP